MDPAIEPTTNVSRPLEATSAVWFIAASFAIGGIRTVFDLAHKMSGGLLLLGFLALVVFLGICFFFVSQIAAGRNWARIVFLVLLIIGLPFAIPGYLVELRTSLPRGAISILMAILQLLGTWLLFTKKSNLWFRLRK